MTTLDETLVSTTIPSRLDGADALEAFGAITSAVAPRTAEDVEAVRDAVVLAYRGRAAESLGYVDKKGSSAWQQCCKVHLAGVQLWSTPHDRAALVYALRRADMSVRAVAAVLRIGLATVHSDHARACESVFGCRTPNHETSACHLGDGGIDRPKEGAGGVPDASIADVMSALTSTEPGRLASTAPATMLADAQRTDEGGRHWPMAWERALATAQVWTLRRAPDHPTERQIATRLGMPQARVHRLLVDARKRTEPDGAGDLVALEEIARRVGSNVEEIDPLEAASALGYDVPRATADREVEFCGLVAKVGREVDKLSELLAAVEAGLDASATPGQRQAARDALAALDIARRRHLNIRDRLGESCPELGPGGVCSRSGAC